MAIKPISTMWKSRNKLYSVVLFAHARYAAVYRVSHGLPIQFILCHTICDSIAVRLRAMWNYMRWAACVGVCARAFNVQRQIEINIQVKQRWAFAVRVVVDDVDVDERWPPRAEARKGKSSFRDATREIVEMQWNFIMHRKCHAVLPSQCSTTTKSTEIPMKIFVLPSELLLRCM